jgi:predicted glycoside hydrolase/deacetylase ChbG (UPF0249 family)
MGKKVIINADDFGLCEGVNEGILKAHLEGVVTSATLMVNMAGAEDAVRMAYSHPSLGVGVHLSLTEGKALTPVNQIPALVNAEGAFLYSPEKLAFLSLVHSDVRKAVYTELQAQVQWVIDRGIKPTHLDSHKHFHCFPPLYSMVCRIAEQFQIRAIRWPFEPKAVSFHPWPTADKAGQRRARVLRVLTRINRLQNSLYIRTQALFGIAHTGNIDFSFLGAVCLYNIKDVVEIMTHPGFPAGLNHGRTRLIEQREKELQALCDIRTINLFRDKGIQLTHYGSI